MTNGGVEIQGQGLSYSIACGGQGVRSGYPGSANRSPMSCAGAI